MEAIKNFLMIIIENLSSLGHPGIFIAMAIESACIPLPSEIILPLAGYMVFMGKGTILSMSVTATLGCLAGSLLAYVIGYYGGRPFIMKYGKYMFISEKDFNKADNFFERYGSTTIFFSRMLPIIRTFISLPAGIARMNVFKFSILTVIGAFPWCVLFIYLGKSFGANWHRVDAMFKNFNYVIAGVLLILILAYIFKKVRGSRKGKIAELSDNIETEDEEESQKKKLQLTIYSYIAIAVSIVSFIGLTDIIIDYITRGYWSFDKAAIEYVYRIRNSGLTMFFKSITYTGNFISIFFITIAIMFFLGRKNRRDSIFFGLCILGVWVFNEILKFVFKRPRPAEIRLVDVSGYSFPSGHAMIFIALSLIFIYFIILYSNKKMEMIILCCLIFLYSLLVGISRVYVGVHYLSDVIGGWFAGTLWASLCVLLHRIILKNRS